ncbi:MAG: sodium-dependent transporter [Clostridia bacterium]|nr:sodium-dependent transporter [Clostridia bacterium]
MKRQWSGSLGFVLAAAGSAIGIGNIWKFPKVAFEGGGGAYLLVYLLIAAILGTSILIAEFVLGRGTGRTMLCAFEKPWRWVGYLGTATAFLVLCYYYQAGGWILRYLFGYIQSPKLMLSQPGQIYETMLGNGGFPFLGGLICPAIYILMNILVVRMGLIRGAERLSRIAMPLLFLLLAVLMARSLTLDGAGAGLAFLLTVDFKALGMKGVLSALGQAFFSLSIGMSVMVTYGSFLKKEEPLAKNAAWVCALDTLSALMAAFLVIPAVFASGSLPQGGGSFAFVEIAAVFRSMPLGGLFGLLFYALLFLAAFVSSVSILEGVLSCFEERWGLSRTGTSIAVSLVALLIGILYSGSYLHGGFSDFLESLTDRYLMPLTALFTCLYLTSVFKMERAKLELGGRGALFSLWRAIISVLSPVLILLILIFSLLG